MCERGCCTCKSFRAHFKNDSCTGIGKQMFSLAVGAFCRAESCRNRLDKKRYGQRKGERRAQIEMVVLAIAVQVLVTETIHVVQHHLLP